MTWFGGGGGEIRNYEVVSGVVLCPFGHGAGFSNIQRFRSRPWQGRGCGLFDDEALCGGGGGGVWGGGGGEGDEVGAGGEGGEVHFYGLLGGGD